MDYGIEQELAMLRKIAENPYDRTRLQVYADWLSENGREDEATIVKTHATAVSPPINCNSISVGELVGHLLTMPLNAPVIYRACSDWSELTRDEVTLSKADDKQIVYRDANGFMTYDPKWFSEETFQRTRPIVQRFGRRYGPDEKEIPQFVTVCCFPGN